MIRIQTKDFELEHELNVLRSDDRIGAIVSFVGVVRSDEGIEALEIESYEEMGLKEFETLEKKAKEEFSICDVLIIHRTGTMKPGENIVLIAVSSEHRKDAFKACEWLIDELKKVVPIWKREIQ